MMRAVSRSLPVRSQAHGWRGRTASRARGAPPAPYLRPAEQPAALAWVGALFASAVVALIGAALALRLLAARRA